MSGMTFYCFRVLSVLLSCITICASFCFYVTICIMRVVVEKLWFHITHTFPLTRYLYQLTHCHSWHLTNNEHSSSFLFQVFHTFNVTSNYGNLVVFDVTCSGLHSLTTSWRWGRWWSWLIELLLWLRRTVLVISWLRIRSYSLVSLWWHSITLSWGMNGTHMSLLNSMIWETLNLRWERFACTSICWCMVAHMVSIVSMSS